MLLQGDALHATVVNFVGRVSGMEVERAERPRAAAESEARWSASRSSYVQSAAATDVST